MNYSELSNNSVSPSTIKTLALVELERRRRSLMGKLRFRGAALQAQTITDSEWIISGPAETGKTFASMYRLHRELSNTPNARATIVRKVRAALTGTALETWRRVVNIGGLKPREYGGESASIYLYPNGSKCYVGGLDNRNKILSGERDFIYVNQAEELTVEDWETLTTRTTGRGAVTKTPMLFGDCNPADPEHWILHRSQAGSLTVLRSQHVDNPSLYEDDGSLTQQGQRTMKILQTLTGTRYARLYLGEWVRGDNDESFLPSMAMYDNCRVDLQPLSRNQPVVIGLDAAINGDTFALVAVSRAPDVDDEKTIALRDVRVWVPNGEALNYVDIEKEIRAIIAQYNVVQIAYDPYQLHYLAQRLSDIVWMEPFNQAGDRLESDVTLRNLIVQRRFYHDGSFPLIREHIANADAHIDATGHRLRMIKRMAHLKIDAAVALSMASYRALELNLW